MRRSGEHQLHPDHDGYHDQPHYESAFIKDTRSVLQHSSNAITLRHQLERLGWVYQRFTSFINSFLRQRRLVFMTPLDGDVDPGLRLEVLMRGGRSVQYDITTRPMGYGRGR